MINMLVIKSLIKDARDILDVAAVMLCGNYRSLDPGDEKALTHDCITALDGIDDHLWKIIQRMEKGDEQHESKV